MEIEKRLSDLIPLLLSAQQKQKISQQVYQSLNGRLNTLIYIIADSSIQSLPEIYCNILNDLLSELEQILKQLINESSSFFVSKIKSWLPGSNISKLEALVPRMLDVTDKIVSNMTVQKYIEKSVNIKRKADLDLQEEASQDNESEEVKSAAINLKKIKVNTEPKADSQNSMSMASSTAKKVIRGAPAPYYISLICAKELEEYLPIHTRIKVPKFAGSGIESTLCIKREDFKLLPKDIVLRLSKDHALISMREENTFQIKNTSVNGIFYMGNAIDHTVGKNEPFKVEKHCQYRLIHGDVIGILMKKDSPREMLLGFEFYEKQKGSNPDSPNSDNSNAIIPESQ